MNFREKTLPMKLELRTEQQNLIKALHIDQKTKLSICHVFLILFLYLLDLSHPQFYDYDTIKDAYLTNGQVHDSISQHPEDIRSQQETNNISRLKMTLYP